MKKEEVKVLGSWGSPFSKRVEMVLRLKGIGYEYIEEDVYNYKSPLLLKHNPIHKKVPVLLHNSNSIVESLVILEYIDETWNHSYPILPQDPHDRAVARFWAKYVDEKVMLALFKALWSSDEAEREKATEEATESLRMLERELGERTFFGGEKMGLVDITASFIAFWAKILQEAYGAAILTAEKFPKLQRWSEDLVGHGVIKEVLPPRERLLAFFKAKPAIPIPLK